MKTGVMLPQVKEIPEARRDPWDSLSWCLQREQGPASSWIQDTGQLSVAPQSCGTSSQQVWRVESFLDIQVEMLTKQMGIESTIQLSLEFRKVTELDTHICQSYLL